MTPDGGVDGVCRIYALIFILQMVNLFYGPYLFFETLIYIYIYICSYVHFYLVGLQHIGKSASPSDSEYMRAACFKVKVMIQISPAFTPKPVDPAHIHRGYCFPGPSSLVCPTSVSLGRW